MKSFTRSTIAVVALSALTLAFGGLVPEAAQATAPAILYVSQTGVDTASCTSTQPCVTVSHALTLAASGATIEVSGTIDDNINVTKSVTITNWINDPPAGSAAILDGTASGTVVHATNTNIDLNLTDLTIENGGGGGGGGIDTDGSIGTTTIKDSTITGNTSDYDNGGGGGIASGGTTSIIDSTITDNTETAGGAGGISNDGGTLTVVASTISGNTGGAAGGIYNGGQISLGGSIVADNTGVNCSGGVIGSRGYDLTNDATSTACGFNAPTDLVNKKPNLLPLANNGGTTETAQPAAGSPAAFVIPQNVTLSGMLVCPGTDQRGYARPVPNETKCSIGAVEAKGPGEGTTTSVTLLPSSVPLGTNVVYVATVVSKSGTGIPTGTVTFTSGSTTLCRAVLSGGSGACGATNAPTGTDTVTAKYSGDPYFALSAGTGTLNVLKVTKITTLASSANPVTTGTPVTFTTIVAPIPNGGTMKYTSNGAVITGCAANTVNTTTGVSTCRTTYSVKGTYTITAVYSGDSTYATSSSNLSEVVS